MKNFLQKAPYILFIALSILTLLQISIIFKDSYSENGKIVFTNTEPQKVDLSKELVMDQEEESGLININSASSSSLESLPGIGPTSAKKIIDNRPYNTTEQLKTKAGISEKVFEDIKDLVSL